MGAGEPTVGKRPLDFHLVFSRPSLPSVTVADVGEGAYLLDVREQDEWDAGHAPEAHHVPMSALISRIDEVPADETVVVICRSGHRSGQVVTYLRGQGRDNVVNLDGGIVDWVAAGRPIVADDGRDPFIG
jgi:rhodanese-related sulfurtransferase